MSDDANAQHEATNSGPAGAGSLANGQGSGGAHETGREFKFSVDGRRFETPQERLTGLQLKAIAGIDPSFALFLEGRGHGSDRQIGDGDTVDLAAPGNEAFYATPPAIYGLSDHAGASATLGVREFALPARARGA